MTEKRFVSKEVYQNFKQELVSDVMDVLDEIEVYEDCVLGIHKQNLTHTIASPMSFNKEYDTYPIAQLLRPVDEDFEVDMAGVEYIANIYLTLEQ